MVADALSDRGVATLVLETGSYVFPTHVANLPRAHVVGSFDKHVWYVSMAGGSWAWEGEQSMHKSVFVHSSRAVVDSAHFRSARGTACSNREGLL